MVRINRVRNVKILAGRLSLIFAKLIPLIQFVRTKKIIARTIQMVQHPPILDPWEPIPDYCLDDPGSVKCVQCLDGVKSLIIVWKILKFVRSLVGR